MKKKKFNVKIIIKHYLTKIIYKKNKLRRVFMKKMNSKTKNE